MDFDQKMFYLQFGPRNIMSKMQGCSYSVGN